MYFPVFFRTLFRWSFLGGCWLDPQSNHVCNRDIKTTYWRTYSKKQKHLDDRIGIVYMLIQKSFSFFPKVPNELFIFFTRIYAPHHFQKKYKIHPCGLIINLVRARFVFRVNYLKLVWMYSMPNQPNQPICVPVWSQTFFLHQ